MAFILDTLSSKRISDRFINFSHFIDHFIMLIFAKAAYDAGKYFNLSYDEIIIYGVFGFVLFGAIAPISAHLADKFSRSLLMVIFHFGIGFSSILAGLSNNVWFLSFSIGLIGVFASIYHPVGIAMLIKTNKNIGFRLGINGVFGNMGVAAAPLITGLLLTVGDWRICFIIPGIFCILYGVLFTINLKNDISDSKNNNQSKKSVFAPNWKMALIALAISSSSGGFIFGAMTFLIPRYFEISMNNVSTSVAITGFLASIVFATASFAQIIVGWIIDRYSPKKVLLFMGFGQIIFIYFASLYQDYLLLFSMLVAMIFVFGQIPITDTIISRYVPDEWRNKVLSIKFLLNLSIGASVLPICGIFLQAGNTMDKLFFVMSLIAIFVAISALLLPNQTDAQRLDKTI